MRDYSLTSTRDLTKKKAPQLRGLEIYFLRDEVAPLLDDEPPLLDDEARFTAPADRPTPEREPLLDFDEDLAVEGDLGPAPREEVEPTDFLPADEPDALRPPDEPDDLLLEEPVLLAPPDAELLLPAGKLLLFEPPLLAPAELFDDGEDFLPPDDFEDEPPDFADEPTVFEDAPDFEEPFALLALPPDFLPAGPDEARGTTAAAVTVAPAAAPSAAPVKTSPTTSFAFSSMVAIVPFFFAIRSPFLSIVLTADRFSNSAACVCTLSDNCRKSEADIYRQGALSDIFSVYG